MGIKLEMMFQIERWEQLLETAYQKGIDYGLLCQLVEPQNRAALYLSIVQGNYHIQVPHYAEIPKDDGTMRQVVVNESLDRIVLTLYNEVLCELFNDKIHTNCKSYQKGIGCGMTVQNISKQIVEYKENKIGYKADLSKYFDSVNLECIEQALTELKTEGDEAIDDVVWEYYHSNLIYDMGKQLIEKYQSLKQGCAVASFLANYLLRDIDEELSSLDIIYCRYSDDILMIGKEADKAKEILEQRLTKYGLSLNPKKVETLYKDTWFTFLGFSIKGDKITLSKKSIKNFQKEIDRRTIKNQKCNTGLKAINQIQKYLYKGYENGTQTFGWAQFFLPILNVKEDLDELNKYLLDVIRACETGKKKIGGLGYKKEQEIGVVTRGVGKNVKANRDNTEKWIKKYYSTVCLSNAIKINKAVYQTLVRQM